jgi:protoporphyrinogen oxidase
VLDRFEQVLRAEGVRVECGEPVDSICSNLAGEVEISFRSGHRERFDRVVVTAPAPIVAAMCPQLSAAEMAQLRGIRYQGIVCASLLLRRPLSGFYVTNITDRWVPFTAVIEMSALVDRRHFGGNALVYVPKYLPSDDPAFGVPDEQIETGIVEALERMYPRFSRDDILCFRVSRARYVLPISTLGYSKRLPPVATSVPGLFAVNSAHIVNGTLNVNETVTLANATIPQLLAACSDERRTRVPA